MAPLFAARRKKHEPQEYQDRLEREIEIIKGMGFPGYFLVVWDFIKYAKDNGIPVGPGRGSAAGSLVAYSMEITDVDPARPQLDPVRAGRAVWNWAGARCNALHPE